MKFNRLRVQCESLILKHPKEYGRRAEERLWRKAFYDVIQKLRNHRKVSWKATNIINTAVDVDEATTVFPCKNAGC